MSFLPLFFHTSLLSSLSLLSASSLLYGIIFLFFLSLLFLWSYIWHQERFLYKQLPSAKCNYSLLFRHTYDLIFQGKIHDWLYEETKKHDGKTWYYHFLGHGPTVVISNESLIDDVCNKHFEYFYKSDNTKTILNEFMGHGIIMADGHIWERQRKLAVPLFSRSMLQDVMLPAIKQKIQLTTDIMEQYATSEKEIDLKQLIERFTMDTFAKIGFGVDLDLLLVYNPKNANTEHSPFRNISRIALFSFQRMYQPEWYWKLKRYLNIGTEKLLKQYVSEMDQFIYDLIHKAMKVANNQSKMQPIQEKKKALTEEIEDDKKQSKATSKIMEHETTEQPVSLGRPSGAGRSKNLISMYLAKTFSDSSSNNEYNNSTKKDEHITSEMKELRDMTVNFLFAGKDTTSQSLTWLFINMNKHPEIVSNIRAELKTHQVGQSKKSLEKLSIEDMDKLIYLEAVIRESLRLSPVVPLNTRTATKDIVLSDNTFLPKDTTVMMVTYTMARDEKIWGLDVHSFKPERWIDSKTGKIIKLSNYKFPIFHAGPRICLGMQLALLEMKLFIVSVLSQFNIQTKQDPFSFQYNFSMILSVKGPVYVDITKVAAQM